MVDFNLDDSDERPVTERAIAAGLAELSAVEVTPNEVDGCSSFDAEDVVFLGDSWIDRVRNVQDWLRLDRQIEAKAVAPEAARQLFEGLSVDSVENVLVTEGDQALLTDLGLELLRDRVERAVELKNRFFELLEEGTVATATTAWIDEWESTVDESITGQIVAKAEIWNINEFAGRAAKGRLELSPSYQRGDVWPTKDAQLLIESIIRGIPLPSVIILRPKNQSDAPYEVVDGKQRLTAILRFMGAHPKAISRVRTLDAQFPEHDLLNLFKTDYPRFRRAWKNATGETLTAGREREYYFPFKMSASSPALVGPLEAVRGKYYHAISDVTVRVGDSTVEIQEIFENVCTYKIPIIEYTEATPKQIHQVFSLYNKQGKHLNAEEIRNAVYHELDFMRALSVAAGDQPDLEAVADFLSPVRGDVQRIAANLDEYRIGDVRYRRTKVLSWLISILLSDCASGDGKPRTLSTAQQVNALLDRIQDSVADPLRSHAKIRDALRLVSSSMEAHAAADAWDAKFRDNAQGAKWQELQLIASLLGVSLSAVVLDADIEGRLLDHEQELGRLTASREWSRPKKTQTATQWQYISRVSLGIVETLGVSIEDVDRELRARFGASCIATLRSIRPSSSS